VMLTRCQTQSPEACTCPMTNYSPIST
jgi:hypothetical protein